MTKQRRWLKSVIATSLDKQIALPFQRGNRRRPEAFRPVDDQPKRLIAVAAR